MNTRGMFLIGLSMLLSAGCASLKEKLPLDADRTAQSFFDDLQKSDNRAAYGLFAKGLSNAISFGQFDDFMKTIRAQWGRIEMDETAVMPFHQRRGEESFIPLNTPQDKIKRYTFDVKFESAEMNFDLTLASEAGVYKIVWFSIWGSNNYLTPQIRQEIENLFEKTANQPGGQ